MKNTEEAHKTNVEIARDLAILSCDLDAKFIQISTDQLFDGKGTFYSEIEEPNPLNEYGLTKWRAEEAVSHEQKNSLILRTNFFGWGPPYRRSLSDWVIDELSKGNTISAFNDVFYTDLHGQIDRNQPLVD